MRILRWLGIIVATHVANPATNVRPIFNFMAVLLNLASGSKRAHLLP